LKTLSQPLMRGSVYDVPSYNQPQRRVSLIMGERFISYLRVSTDRQGRSGLGIDAQRAAVNSFMNGAPVFDEIIEIETGKNDDRPKLAQALARCRLTGATLLVAKLDRLSRDAAFILNLAKSDVAIRVADMPEANTMVFGMMAVIAQHEREMISARTQEALGAAKRRGIKLGGYRGGPVPDGRLSVAARVRVADAFAAKVGPTIMELRESGHSLARVAEMVSSAGIRTARGGDVWTATGVRNLLNRLSA
jgi:DNA invertase Pin-like site-specific DNA recombinase